ncbi:MAG: hypothetical protein QMC36_04655 [Patescibacteria group bacterium]
MNDLKERIEELYRVQGDADREVELVLELTEALFEDNRYDLVDDFLMHVDTCRLGPLSLEGILRSSFRFRHVLPTWGHFLGEARGLLANMGHDADVLLAGLEPISQSKPQNVSA